eukprot:Seg3491.1 transcript_id=Seg3491.1/GoldUCD/mRNA.D3Y31 product="hypothetical protein" protein_id=Seg3491.1/GoldUCD/D3Y31
MSGTIRVKFRVEYKGESEDVETPHPIDVEMDDGSTVIDLLSNASRFHNAFGFTSRYIPGVGDVVTSFNNLFNDEEPNMRWIFYSPASMSLHQPLGKVKLSAGDEVVARYERLQDREDQLIQLGLKKLKH